MEVSFAAPMVTSVAAISGSIAPGQQHFIALHHRRRLSQILAAKRRPMIRKSVTFAASAMAALGLAVGGASPASAAAHPDATGPSTNQVNDPSDIPDTTMYGAYILHEGPLQDLKAWCVDAGLAAPKGDAYDEDGKRTVEAPELGYVLSRYDKTYDDPAEQMAWDMAVATYVKSSDEVNHRHILDVYSPIDQVLEDNGGPGWDLSSDSVQQVGEQVFTDEVVPAAQEHWDEIQSHVSKYMGDYSTEIKLGEDEIKFRVLVDGDTPVPDMDATVKLDRATFEDGETSKAFTSKDGWTTVPIQAENGDVAAEVTVTGVPSDTVTVWKPKEFVDSDYDRFDVQSLITMTPPTTVKDSDSTVVKVSPSISTKLDQNKLTSLPAKVTDEGHVKECAPGREFPVTTDVYRVDDTEMKRTDEVPEGAKKVDSLTQTVTCGEDGTVKYKTSEFSIPEDAMKPGEAASFTFVVSTPGDDYMEAYTSDFGVPEETLTVELPEATKPVVKQVKTGAHVVAAPADDDGTNGPNMGLLVGGLASLIGAGTLATVLLTTRRKC